MEINLGELAEIVIQPKAEPGFELARVKWIFSSGAEIRGGRITQSKKNPDIPWVQLPKYRAGNNSWPHVIKLTEEMERHLENRALAQYQSSRDGDTPPISNNNDEVSYEEIAKLF